MFCGLIEAGIAGAKEVDPSVKTMVHLAWGGQNAQVEGFLEKPLPRVWISTSSASRIIRSGTGHSKT